MIGEERDQPVVLETVDSRKIGAGVRTRKGWGGGGHMASLDYLPAVTLPLLKKNRIIFFTSGFLMDFSALYSTLLYLPPFRFHCVRTFATTALAVRRSNHWAKSYPHSAKSHPPHNYGAVRSDFLKIYLK